jgi:hypothetical protein
MAAPLKPVLMAYANYADESGYTWAGIELIAFDTGYGKTAVVDARAELIAAGWLATKRRFGTSAITRLNLAKLADAAVDRGDRTRIKTELEFEEEESAGGAQRTATRSIEPTSGSRTAATRSSNNRPAAVGTTATRSQSISDSSENSSIEGAEGDSPEAKPEPAAWALELIAGLDYGRHRRPTKRQAGELAALLEAAVAEHGQSRTGLARHCRAAVSEATKNAVAYLRGALEGDRLPVPSRAASAPSAAAQNGAAEEPAAAPVRDLTAEDLLARGLDPKLLPKRLQQATT